MVVGLSSRNVGPNAIRGSSQIALFENTADFPKRDDVNSIRTVLEYWIQKSFSVLIQKRDKRAIDRKVTNCEDRMKFFKLAHKRSVIAVTESSNISQISSYYLLLSNRPTGADLQKGVADFAVVTLCLWNPGLVQFMIILVQCLVWL